MKKLDKRVIMEKTPMFALPPILLALVLIIAEISLVGGIACLGIGVLIAIGGLLLAADTFRQIVSRFIGTCGVLLFGVGVGVAIATDSSVYGVLLATLGVVFFVWAFRRTSLSDESIRKSIIILVATILATTLLVIGGYRAITNDNYSSSGNCFNCGGDGWDSENHCSCVWCGGDGYSSWNP